MSLLKDFKAFAMRGNVMDLAVAVILGAAFGAIVSSFVDDLLNPLLLAPALEAVGVSEIAELHWGTVKYGNFLAAVIKFLVFAFVIFMLIRTMQKFEKKEDEAPAEPSSTDKLLTEIRDELKRR